MRDPSVEQDVLSEDVHFRFGMPSLPGRESTLPTSGLPQLEPFGGSEDGKGSFREDVRTRKILASRSKGHDQREFLERAVECGMGVFAHCLCVATELSKRVFLVRDFILSSEPVTSRHAGGRECVGLVSLPGPQPTKQRSRLRP